MTTYDFEVLKGPGDRPCVFKLRRMDLLTQLMEDVVNAPLLEAAMQIIAEIQEWINADTGRNFESAFQNLTAEKKRTVLEQLQHYACHTVLQPKLTKDPASEPAAFPVALLSASTLFAIWNHQPPEATVPRLSEVAADTFHPPAGHEPGGAAPSGAGVRPGALDVDPGRTAAGQP